MSPDPVKKTPEAPEAHKEWRKKVQKARPHIIFYLAEKLATLVTSSVIHNAATKQFWKWLCNTYQRKTFQAQLNLITKHHNVQLSENEGIHDHLTRLIEMFVDLAQINDSLAEGDKSDILLRSL